MWVATLKTWYPVAIEFAQSHSCYRQRERHQRATGDNAFPATAAEDFVSGQSTLICSLARTELKSSKMNGPYEAIGVDRRDDGNQRQVDDSGNPTGRRRSVWTEGSSVGHKLVIARHFWAGQRNAAHQRGPWGLARILGRFGIMAGNKGVPYGLEPAFG